MKATATLPLKETLTPADEAELSQIVRNAFEAGQPIYPIGGGMSLGYGLPARSPGRGISLEKLSRVVDYPNRDLTITVEAGITMGELARTLAAEHQWLPIDVPHADQATLGGAIATNTSGPRRYGSGTIRDYVIGIRAVDGRGMRFHGGGRVVKNVAGYDFCKLLVGSLGTLAVITQVTLKVKPRPEASAFLTCDLPDLVTVERLLAAMVTSRTTPAAIELLSGKAWSIDSVFRLAVGLEGSQAEVDWMAGELAKEWQGLGVGESNRITGEAATTLWQGLTEFQSGGDAPLVVKCNVLPSRLCGLIDGIRSSLGACSIQAHAGNGILYVQPEANVADAGRMLVQSIQPAAARAGGSAIVWHWSLADEPTRQVVWGTGGSDVAVMRAVKEQFDPRGLLNPGRFVYGNA